MLLKFDSFRHLFIYLPNNIKSASLVSKILFQKVRRQLFDIYPKKFSLTLYVGLKIVRAFFMILCKTGRPLVTGDGYEDEGCSNMRDFRWLIKFHSLFLLPRNHCKAFIH